jgi:uncharacterized damage-inducible protein DinB
LLLAIGQKNQEIMMDFLTFIPQEVRQRIFDSLIDVLTDQVSSVLGDKIGSAINKLRSDANLREEFEKALKRAVRRFAAEYADQNVILAITSNVDFWNTSSIQKALREIITHPSSYLEGERDIVHQTFADVLPNLASDRVEQAVIFLLRCLAEEIVSLPQFQPIYMVQFQKASLEKAQEMVCALHELRNDQRIAINALLQGIADRKLLVDTKAESKPNLLSVALGTRKRRIEVLLRELISLRNAKREIRQILNSNDQINIDDYKYKLQDYALRIRYIKTELVELGQQPKDDAIDDDSFSSYPVEIVYPCLRGETIARVNLVNLDELHEMLIAYLQRVELAVTSVDVGALNWKPFPNSNSIYVLATHIVGSTEEWVCRFAGGMNIQRNRDAEFIAVGATSQPLKVKIREVQKKIGWVFDNLKETDLDRVIVTPGRFIDKCTGLWCIVHAIEHSGYHLGELDAMVRFYDFFRSSIRDECAQ